MLTEKAWPRSRGSNQGAPRARDSSARKADKIRIHCPTTWSICFCSNTPQASASPHQGSGHLLHLLLRRRPNLRHHLRRRLCIPQVSISCRIAGGRPTNERLASRRERMSGHGGARDCGFGDWAGCSFLTLFVRGFLAWREWQSRRNTAEERYFRARSLPNRASSRMIALFSHHHGREPSSISEAL